MRKFLLLESTITQDEGLQPEPPWVAHLRVKGKGGKKRFVPTGTITLIEECLKAAGHGQSSLGLARE